MNESYYFNRILEMLLQIDFEEQRRVHDYLDELYFDSKFESEHEEQAKRKPKYEANKTMRKIGKMNICELYEVEPNYWKKIDAIIEANHNHDGVTNERETALDCLLYGFILGRKGR